ncbi:hypothetical protein B0H14DRAFT_3051652 [Mycena olivaceomarginata]|nr:hypothetical protein B0H14DRAFT_3051652 [Mycena olivaceomarginata]
MSVSPNESLQLSERPLDKKLVSELVEIAKAININTAKLHKPEILKAIKAHIQTHPGLGDSPHLLPLVGHRTAPKTVGKTSAGKATEEEMESSKPKEPATGANRALLEHEVKTDPPPQYKKLSPAGPKGDEIAEPAGAEDSSDLSGSDAPPQSRNHSPEPDQKAEKVEKTHEMSAVIQVNFLDQTNHGVAHRQVLVDEFPIAVSTADNGTKKYTTLLSDLLPASIQNDSPIKERGGRLYRSNIRDEPTAPHHLGKIDTLLAKSSNALLTRQMKEYNLVPLSDGSFVCDVFWEQPSITRAPQAPQATHPEGIQTITGPLQFTGTGSDVPLDIANSRAQFSPLHEHALPGLRAEFVDFLHADQGHDWGRCKYAGESLDRYLLQQAAFDFFAGWGRTAGGFAVPRGHDKFSGVSFKKELIFEVLNIKSSSTSDINKLFAPERLEKAPRAKAWVNSKGETNDDSFRKTTTIGFKKYLQEDHRKVRKSGNGKSRRRSSGSRSPGRARKYRKSGSGSEDSDAESLSGRTSKGRMDSENLDASDREH